ncbi:hypothetical protein B0T22DRAFT_466967 [Podospora appendiculata]|uniref:BOD1/SHG1 domain-containing protein n=1 Tax=Podospora appendiculata TaxID=314037 RepID=A0AAE0X647_9PEZI|nr:hypothetical protein B0T22DRAFT_466967 [Podospora appendiculata]
MMESIAPVPAAVAGASDAAVPLARKFKASELPLTSATRLTIDGLTHTFKKKGGYDAIRKQVWDKIEASVCLFCPWYLCSPCLSSGRAVPFLIVSWPCPTAATYGPR